MAQEEANHVPLEMLLHSIQAVVHSNPAKREKAEGFDFVKEQKKRDALECRLLDSIEREE